MPVRAFTPWKVALVGAGFGLALFAAESALVLRTGAIGLDLDTQGPFAAVLAAVRPLLPGLLTRVAVAYALAGAVLALAASALAWVGGPPRVWVCLLEAAALSGLLCWAKAIARPALFDDLPPLRPLLGWLVDHGEPWHPQVALFALLGAHALGALRRNRGKVAVGVVSALVMIGVETTGQAPARPKLLLLYGIDAFRPDQLSAFGGKGDVAPHLERFLQGATSFERAYTPIAQTEPAWRSLVTARWPFATGVRYPLTPDRRVEDLPTFPEALRLKGFHTTFQTDCSRFNWLGPNSGFEERHEPPRGALNFALEKLRYRALGLFADNALGARWLPEFIDNRALAGIYDPLGYAKRLAGRVIDEARAGPLLFAFHSTSAHFPGDPVYPFYRRFVSADQPLERRLRMTFSPIRQSTAPPAPSAWAASDSEKLYQELLAQADAQFGAVVDRLKENGLYDDAVIIVFSDHGESFHRDRPEMGGATPVHGARLSEEENRILLAVKLPRGQAHVTKVDALVRLVDIGPTLLELGGAQPVPSVDGVSLLPLIRGQPFEPLRLYAETGFTHATPEVFDPDHLPGAPRAFDSYRVRPDGVVEMADEEDAALVAEKDRGAFDGKSWWIEAPQKNGSVAKRCRGPCDDPALEAWLDGLIAERKKE